MNEPGLTLLLPRLGLAALAALVLLLPPWWALGRLPEARAVPFFRLLAAAASAAVGWLGFINLLGRPLENSLLPACAWLAVNGLASAWLLWRRRGELSPMDLFRTWRSWAPVLLCAVLVGLPQWLLAVSTPFWDEVASSAIHLTAPSQFAEGLFPPRHNAFPDLPIKYHYAVTMLPGTLMWLTKLSANVSVDLVSTSLHLFTFLFVFLWLQQLGLRRLACFGGGFTVLLGGGLSWLYAPWLETYDGWPKLGRPAQLLHRFDPARSWLANLLEDSHTAAFHLHNLDGTNSNLPWDIASQFQQHAVALGIASTLFAAWLFCTWLWRDRFAPWLFAACAFTFGLLPLCHAVFGSTACLAAGLLLLLRFLQRPGQRHLLEGAVFTGVVAALALAHGGVFSRGAAYGTDFGVLSFRHGLGYSLGGFSGFLNWNLAGFGLPLLLALAALLLWAVRRQTAARPRRLAFAFFAALLVASYLPPQLFYYSYGGGSIEEHTEISKFFFVTHLALGLLSAFALGLAGTRLRWWHVAPAFAAMAVIPLLSVYAAAFTPDNRWLGFYAAPYTANGAPDSVKLGRAFGELKRSNRDVYYDTSWTSERRGDFLDEAQIFGGSVFNLAPRRFERNGSFLIDRTVVAERARQNSRMMRLRPGAEKESGAGWIFAQEGDLLALPVLVRSRFDKLVAEGTLVEEARGGARALYRIAGTTDAVDEGLERFYRPRAVVQTHADGLFFYDRKRQQIATDSQRLPVPPWMADDFVHLIAGRFGAGKTLLAARLADTHYWRGQQIADLADYRAWFWSSFDPKASAWTPEASSGFWDLDVPLAADLRGDGVDRLIFRRSSTGEWLEGARPIEGPRAPPGSSAIPLAGRFSSPSAATLALFEPRGGTWRIGPADTVGFQLGEPGDIAVPGDYDGTGLDQAAVYRPFNQTWYLRDASARVTAFVFGSPTCIPLPADYDRDGRLDLACWEPQAREIRVSFTRGKSVDRVIPVPPDSLPLFVNLY